MPFLQGKIIAIKPDKIQIDFQTESKCLQQNISCAHMPFIWRLLRPKKTWFYFNEAIHLNDNVIVSIPNSAFQQWVLRLYGLPLLGLWLGGGLGEMLGHSTTASLAGAITLFCAAWGVNFLWPAPQISIQKLTS